MKKSFLCYLLPGCIALFINLSLCAQNRVAAPMKDVNNVIDNTSVSYTHLTLPTTERV